MPSKMTDEDIIRVITSGTKVSVGYGGSKLATEREKILNYRDGTLPKRTGPNDASYVSRDVDEGIASMTAQLLEVFAANKRPVVFDPGPKEGRESANLRTEVVTDVIFSQNPGFQILQETLDDSLSGRVSVVKAWWETKHEFEEYDLSDATFQSIQQYLATTPHSEIKEVEQYDPEDGDTANPGDLKRVRFSIRKDRSQVRIAVIPPEEFGISARAVTLDDAEVVFHKQRKSLSELRGLGFKESLLDECTEDNRNWMDTEPEVSARFAPVDDSTFGSYLDTGDAKKTCLLYESYATLDVEGTGHATRWKIMSVGQTLLHKEKVTRIDMAPFVPLPRSHSFWGSSFGLQLIPIQNAKTYLMRSTINHAIVTNNPMKMVVKGAVMNPRELLENKFGGIVNVTRPDGIIPLPQSGLNPFIFQALAALNATKEETTGISALSQGLDKDAISKQNSGDMVHELISVSQLRQKVIARNFAETFLRGLYTMVYKLVVENESEERLIHIAGAWEAVDFTTWSPDCRLSVSFCLGYGEPEKEVAKWANLHKFLGADPTLAPNYGPDQKYAVIRAGLEAMGIRDVDTYWLPMDKVVPPPPDPMIAADLDVKKADAEVKRANAKAAVANLEVKQAMHMTRAQIDEAKLQHTIAMDGAELELQRQIASHATTTDARAIVNVKG